MPYHEFTGDDGVVHLANALEADLAGLVRDGVDAAHVLVHVGVAVDLPGV
jgi:hypothetical protein